MLGKESIMAEEENKQTNVSSQSPTEAQLAEALIKQRAESVSKEDYVELQGKYNAMVETVINGSTASEEANEPKADINQLRREFLSNEPMSNLEYCKKALELREAVIADGGLDPFLPKGYKINPTQEDYECAERVAKVLKETIEQADGNSEYFTAMLNAKMADPILPKRKR